MAQVGPGSTMGARVSAAPATGFLEWGPVFAGAVTAAALSFVLLTFGSAIGLSAVSPWPNSGMSSKTIASLAVFWALAQQIGALMIGGYIAGRMRTRWTDASSDEVEFRDGLHGVLVWAVSIAIGAVLFLSAAGALAKTGTDLASKAATIAATSNTDPLAYYADTLLRPGAVRTTTAQGQASRVDPASAETKAELTRILSRAIANGSLVDADKTYLSSLVAQRTGLSQQEAEARVGDAYVQANRAAREAADKARRAALLTGFVTAAGLLISLAAAWWAAQRGGHHRDNAVPAKFVFGPPRRAP
jgi:hypothetical protein